MMNTPQSLYEEDLAKGAIEPDASQKEAVLHLERVHQEWVKVWQSKSKKMKWFSRKRVHIPGVYLWGSVGVGKTYLMDLFFHSLPSQRKLRKHFHGFMRDIHLQLRQLQGTKNPLTAIAKDLKSTVDILCFDEFFVKDIGDAMIFKNLLMALFQEGLTLVMTSNTVPDELYLHGLQRDLFLPAIGLIKQHLEIFHVTTKEDYRLRELTEAGVYFSPCNEASEAKMKDIFYALAREVVTEPLLLGGRTIPVIARGSSVIWFEFNVLCHVPRSQVDYLDIAEQFHTVLLSHVPQLGPKEEIRPLYFIYLIDVFYDKGVQLIVSAETDILHLYPSGPMAREFQRAQSRLVEMQTKEYLSKAHGGVAF